LPGLFGGHAQELEGALAHCLGAGLPVQGTLRVLEPAGAGHRWLQYSLEPLGAGWCQGLLDDVSASTTTPVAAGLPATSDRLTGALNRLGAEYALAERFAAGARGIGILLADLDRFEGVNREFGRQAGDAVLLRATLRLAAALRRSDSVARLADDTFVVILDRLEDPEAGLRIADKLRAALAQPFPLEAGGEVRITVSIGLTLRRVGEEPSRSALLGRADQALRAAKAAGGNCGRLV
jgi:diguanylate cyclase (GGDEF)-like protein